MTWDFKGLFKRFLEAPNAGGIDQRSPSGRGRIRYNNATKTFQGSADQGPYLDFSTGGGVVAVDTVAELSALDDTALVDGAPVEVNSVQDLWTLDKGSTLVADGITVAVTASGTGRWLRRELGSVTWTSQATWYIDPVNGDDEAVGSTAGTAIQTWDELRRRFGRLSITQFITVNLLGDLGDIVADFNCELLGNAFTGAVIVNGVRTQDATAVIDAQTPHNNASGSRAFGRITFDVDVSAQLNKLMVVEDGARAGAVSWHTKVGAAPAEAITGPFVLNFAEVFPNVGDTVGFYSLTEINSLAVEEGCVVLFTDCHFVSDATIVNGNGQFSTCSHGGRVYFEGQSTWSGGITSGLIAAAGGITVIGAQVLSTGINLAGEIDSITPGGYLFVFGGTTIAAVGNPSNNPIVSLDCEAEVRGSIAFYDVDAATTCVQVRGGGMVRVITGGNLWGRNITAGGAGFVIEARANSVVTYPNANLPDFTANADIYVGGTSTTLAGLPVVTAANFSGIVVDQ